MKKIFNPKITDGPWSVERQMEDRSQSRLVV